MKRKHWCQRSAIFVTAVSAGLRWCGACSIQQRGVLSQKTLEQVSRCKINFVGIHETNIRHTEFYKYEKPGPEQQLVGIACYISFYQKHSYVSFHHEGIQ